MGLGIGRKMIGAAGHGLTSAGGSKAAMLAIGAGAFGLGFLNKTAPAARDAAFDFAFGNPDADVAFTGRKIDTRFLLGTAMGGPVGAMARMSSPENYLTFNSPTPGPVNLYGSPGRAVAGLGIGAGIGGVIGGIAGRGKGALIGAGIGGFLGGTGGMGSVGSAPFVTAGGAVAGAVAGGVKGFQGGVKRGIAGTILGAIGGAAGGAALSGAMIGGSVAPALAATRAQMSNNQLFYQQSPLRSKSSTMELMSQTNAVGDIVLGMHNSRRGY